MLKIYRLEDGLELLKRANIEVIYINPNEERNPMKNNTKYIPFLLAVCLIAGIAIGTFYANHFSGNKLGIINTSSNKLNALLRIIDDQYVDTVKMSDLVEEAMPQILSELDPHSSYIPAKNLEAVNSELKRKFQRHRYSVHHSG